MRESSDLQSRLSHLSFSNYFLYTERSQIFTAELKVAGGPNQPLLPHNKCLSPVIEQGFVYRWLIRDLTESFRRTDASWLTSLSSTWVAFNKMLLQEKVKWYIQLKSSACSAVHRKLGNSNEQNQANWRKIITTQRGLSCEHKEMF